MSTIEPITTTITPDDGAVVGVAAPVIVTFGLRAQDKALVEKHVHITTTPAVEGSWAWIQHDGYSYPSLDWRPKSYWPAGTKVHVEADTYGVKFADGWYGGSDTSVDFTIGRNQVVLANAKTHAVTVQQSGKTVATYPASFGMGDDPNSEFGIAPQFVTRSGHLHRHGQAAEDPDEQPQARRRLVLPQHPRVLGRADQRQRRVPALQPGHHQWQLGHVNKTHGCINLGAAGRHRLLQLGDLRRPRGGDRDVCAAVGRRTATSTTGRSRGHSGSRFPRSPRTPRSTTDAVGGSGRVSGPDRQCRAADQCAGIVVGTAATR